jgi:hypothetical protein
MKKNEDKNLARLSLPSVNIISLAKRDQTNSTATMKIRVNHSWLQISKGCFFLNRCK